MISLLWAMDKNRVIGINNNLPWHLPEDLKYFKQVTMGHSIIMGRKTRDSIGRNLPGRENIVITRNKNYECDGCTILHSVKELKNYQSDHKELFVIGGAEIFKETLPIADKLYLTEIHEEFEGDTFFPEINMDEWTLISKKKGERNEKNPYHYDFLVYEKK